MAPLNVAFADNSFPYLKLLDTIPKGKRVNLGTDSNPDLHQCFNLDEMKLILKLGSDFITCQEVQGMKDLKIQEQQEVMNDLKRIAEAQVDVINIKNQQIERLNQMWEEENRLRNNCEHKPFLGSSLGWIVAGVMAVVNLSLIVTIAVN